MQVTRTFGAKRSMITELVKWLCKWQTLLGAAIGGIIGLLSALIVAHSARRREEISAAMVLVGNMVKVVASFQILLKKSEGEGVPADKHHRWLSEKLAKFHPPLSPMFEASVARIMPVSGKLASHLELFSTIYSDVEKILARIADDYESYRRTGEAPRSKEEMDADAGWGEKRFRYGRAARHLCRAPSFNTDSE